MKRVDFMQQLGELLSFMTSDEQQIVSSYLDGRLSEKDEKEIPSPAFAQAFSEKLQACYGSDSFSLTQLLPSVYEEALKISGNEELEDVIFSKPLTTEKAPEVIHSMEDKEVKTLYGEKVAVEGHNLSTESNKPEPIDVMNGLTEEEIQSAKEKTLEKTEHFHDSEDEPKKYLLEEEEDAEPDTPEVDKNEKPQKEYRGLLNELVQKIAKRNEKNQTLLILLSILISPILLAIAGIVLVCYTAVCAGILAIALVLFLSMIFFVTAGVVELVHGFLLLFENVPAALIELGFGTMLVAVILSITALIYEFIFGIVPKWLRFITSMTKTYTKLLLAYLFGGKA